MKLKLRLKFILILIIIPFLLFVNLIPSLSPSKAKASNNVYTQKIVAVVYDDSGSMQWNKYYYAKYAMQVLMSTMDSRDLLKVFTMNNEDFEVDLTAPDRNKVVQECDAKLKASGGTPGSTIDTAVNWLVTQHGLNKFSTVEGKEFKLIIITDGAFDEYYDYRYTTSKVVGDKISGYIGLQTSFFGICLDDSNFKVETLVSQNSSVKGYYANNATQIVSEMQKVINSTTGRYKMEKGVTYDPSDRRIVYVDLNNYDFSIASLEILAQGSSGNVRLKSYDCSLPLTRSRECNLQSIYDYNGIYLYGYSALLTPNSTTQPFLYKERIKLVFESAPTDVLILLEPAIEMTAALQYQDGSNWVDITEQEINSNLLEGHKIRTRYKLTDANTGKDLSSILTDVDVSVSYNNVVYKYDDVISLVEGKNEIALSVTVNISGAKYTLYNSWACDIDADPSHYRIKTDVLKNYNGNPNKVRLDYTIYYKNIQATKSQLEGTNKLYKWELTELIDPAGNSINATSSVSGGTISFVFDKSPGKYGTYKSIFKIVRIENGKTRLSNTDVELNLTDISIVKGDNNDITVSSYDIRKNTKQFSFNVNDGDGYPINFNSGLIGYSLKIDGVDVTKNAVTNGNTLTYLPNGSMPANLQKVGEHNAVIEVWSLNDTSVKSTATSKLNVTTTEFKVVTNTTVGVNGDANKVKVDYSIYCNNKLVSENDLKGTNPAFSWSNIKVLDPKGNTVTPTSSVAGGTISVIFSKQLGNYGVYKSSITIEKIGDNSPKTTEVEVENYIADLIIANGSNKTISLNPYEIKRNTKPFEFTVTDKGYPINFDSGLIGYTLKIGGVDVTSSVTVENNKLTYIPNSNLPTKLQVIGNYDVVLDVWSMQNANIKEKSTLKLSIIQAPTFNIVTNTTDGVNGDVNKVKIDFTVYYGGKVVSESELTGTNKVFGYELVELKDPQGNDITPQISIMGGTISVIYTRTPGNYGVYKSKINVTKIDDNRLITALTSTDYYISDLIITNGSNKTITLNSYELKRNDKAFEFVVTDKGHPINFKSNLIGYSLKIGGVDVTSYATVLDNKLTIIPSTRLPSRIQSIGNYDVVLDVWSLQNTSVREQSTLKFNVVTPPNFEIKSNTTVGVNGDVNKVKIDYTIYYGDKVVSESHLTGTTPIFSYELVELKDPQGNDITPQISVIGGTISVIFDRTPGNYGIYKSKINVTKIDDNRLISKADNLEYYISNLIITNGNNKVISLNTYELKRNNKAFEFTVTDNGHPIYFKSSLIGYSLKIGGVDVTSYSTVVDNTLTYIPNSSLPTKLQAIGDYDVILEVWSFRDSKIKSQSKLTLQIVKAPDLNIVPNTTVGINGDENKVKIDYVVYYNGQVVNETDLTNGIFDWEILEMVDPSNNDFTPQVNIVGGTISVTFDKRLGLYGSYKSKIKVTKVDDNRSITSDVEVKHGITELIIANGTITEIIVNPYELKRNTKAFEFTVTDKGYPINFNSGLIGYTLKIDGIDVTKYATIENNLLKFVPDANMPSNLLGISNKKVVLEVWSKNSNARQQSTLKLNIIKAPNFNILTNITVGVDGDENKIKVDYTVYYDDKKVDESELNGNNPIFSWDVVELKDPKGNSLTPLGSVTGGTISVIFDKTPGNYGVYTSKINVTKIDDNRPVVSEVKVEYYITDLIITKPTENDLTLNPYELKRNTKAFEFSVTDKGYPINFDSGLIGYSLKIGGVDVTSLVQFDGNTLKFVPNSTMPTELQSVKDYAVVLEVWSKQNPNIKENSISQLSIIEAPNFNITSKSTLGVDGDSNKIKVDYTVYYDDKIVSKSQLENGSYQVFKLGKVEIDFSEDKNFNPQYDVVIEEGVISIIFNKIVDKFGVYTLNVSVIKIDDNRPTENKIEIDCFITDLKIAKGQDNDILLTTYELRKNTKPFEFTLTNEDRPINFNSGSIGYSLIIGGLDVTEYAIIENNVLKFVPNLNMPSILQQVKDKEVILEVWSVKDASINAKAVSKLSIIESVYIVEAINGDDTSVDIYNLKNCNAKVYYKISVDGDSLPMQELLDGLNDGLIQVDTRPFGWLFLLPTNVNVDVVQYNGNDVIRLSVGTNWISPLDNLFASFIFTGDKTLTVECGNAKAEATVSLLQVDFFSRLWRWVVIVVTLYIIIHTLLWIIGFFVAKSLPKGALIQMKIKPENSKFLVNITSELINTEKKTIFLWHLKRYIPFMEFRDQDPISKFGVTLQIEDRDGVMVHGKNRSIIKFDLDDDEISDLIRKWRRNWQEYQGGSRPKLKLTTKQLMSLVDDMDKDVKTGSIVGISENYYATKNIKGKIDTIIFFKYID